MPPISEGQELVIGDVVATFQRVPTLHNFNRFAAVNYEFVDHHMDDDAGRRSGFPGVIGMGNLTFAWLHCMLRSAFGGRGRIESIECQFRSPVLRDDTVTCTATVASVTPDGKGTRVDLVLQVTNQRGEDLTPGSATVVIA
jgi:acyl dehydratase